MTEIAGLAILLTSLAVLAVVLPWLGGWRGLSAEYPATTALSVGSPISVTPYVGAPWLPFWAGVGANKEGLYLEPAFPLSLVFAPAFLPWSDVSEEEAAFGWVYTVLRTSRRADTPLFFVKESYDGLCSRSGHTRAAA